MRPFVVGTAGHIDHGKSALVQALTGTNPDRLPEEKRRGITIDLGFAHGTLADGVQAAFVDVPGHEKFVRTMVAGAHGVDVVLFVVALDEGLMPQSREHADICRLLAVPRTVVALTKDDLASQLDPEWPALVEADVRALGGAFEAAPIVRVSARTGAGIDTLKQALADAARTLPPRPTAVPPMLPIDRVFSLKGHGTVVTGTLLAGTMTAGEEFEIATPAPRNVSIRSGQRARTLQVHGASVTKAYAGQRVAVNVPGIEVAEVERGAALVGFGTGHIRQSALLDVVLESVPAAPVLKNRSKVMLHVGTAQAMATVDLLGLGELAPGESTVAQLRLDRALPVLRDQRFVLRGFRVLARGGQTVAGGRILFADHRKRRSHDHEHVEALGGEAASVVAALLEEAGARGWSRVELRLLLNELPTKLPGIASGDRLFAASAIEGTTQRLRALIRERSSVPREEARTALGEGVHPLAFELAAARLGPEFVVGEMLMIAAARRDPLEDKVEQLLVSGGLGPPTAGELATSLKADKYAIGGALRALAKAGKAVRLTDELFVGAGPAGEFRRRVVESLQARGELTTLELKELAGVSRKFAIPLCEWLDREHVTLRVGEKRTLRRGSQS
jgi:selenocysteine-specific elongation factor